MTSKILHFLRRGPAYILTWLRWKLLMMAQRVFSFSYTKPIEPLAASVLASYRQQMSPEFFFAPGDIAERIAKIPDEQKNRTVAVANAVCDLRFSFRQSETHQFDKEIDWHFAKSGNKDWRWDLNRHEYYETLGRAYAYTGDSKYVAAFSRILTHWIANNPPNLDGPNWTSPFEVGYRINSWIWAFFLFRHSDHLTNETLDALITGIRRHCQFLHTNLERHARNNHLLLEAKALWLGAFLFPEFPESREWLARAKSHLLAEVRHQVCADGVHGERSTHYHRVIAGELLELRALLKRNGQTLPADIDDLIRKMAQFDADIRRPDGSMPLFGDSSDTDNYARFSAAAAGPPVFGQDSAIGVTSENEIWRIGCVGGTAGPSQKKLLTTYPEGGYFIINGASDAWMCIDSGPFGLAADPHHGHADALSFELFANGRSWLVDSGVYSTHADWKWRRYFRGTRSHNTIMIDGYDQSELLDSRRVSSEARATCQFFDARAGVVLFHGEHDGFKRLRHPVLHQRYILFTDNQYWLVVDAITGLQTHSVVSNLHFAPDIDVSCNGDTCLAQDRSGRSIRLVSAATAPLKSVVLRGESNPVQGWRSRNSGEKTPAATLSQECHSPLPVFLATAITLDLQLPDTVSIDNTSGVDGAGAIVTVSSGNQQDQLAIGNAVGSNNEGGIPFGASAWYGQSNPA